MYKIPNKSPTDAVGKETGEEEQQRNFFFT